MTVVAVLVSGSDCAAAVDSDSVDGLMKVGGFLAGAIAEVAAWSCCTFLATKTSGPDRRAEQRSAHLETETWVGR